MRHDLDRRAYDLLRLVDIHEPIGSIRLVSLLHSYGYSIKDRTVRLLLSELDDAGLTEKVPGQGRKLTETGRAELKRGNVSGRFERLRERIAMLTSQVTYDPLEDAGEVIASAAFVPRERLDAALDALAPLAELPLGPVVLALDTVSAGQDLDDRVRICAPSRVMLDGVLLSRGISAELQTAGLVEYHPSPDASQVPHDGRVLSDFGGAILRYTDAISGEQSTIDVVSLLIEARRSSVCDVLDGDGPGLFIADNRECPVTRYEEAHDLSAGVQRNLGGVLDVRKPREDGPFPNGKPSWEFVALTYSGIGELAIALLAERGLADEWETLYGLVPRAEFEPLAALRADRESSRE